MKYFILDWLACPFDKFFPLSINIEKSSYIKGQSYLKCKFYCSRHDTYKIGDISKRDCEDCANFEIESGELRCPSCGKRYPIIDGIPDMICFEEFDPIAQIKMKEIEVRDREAPVERKFYSDYMWYGEIPPVLKLLKLSDEDILLELGCGSGRFTGIYSRRCTVFAVDFSLRALQECKKNSDGKSTLHLIRANIEYLPFLKNRFNKIVSTQVMCYLPEKARFKSYAEIIRVLHDNGSFVMTVYNYNQIKKRDGFPKEFFSPAGIYNFYFTRKELVTELERFFNIDFLGGILHFIDMGTSLAMKFKNKMRIIDYVIEKTPLSSFISFLHLVKCTKKETS